MRTRPIIRIGIPLLAITVFGFHYWSRTIPTASQPRSDTSSQHPGFSLADYAAVLKEDVTSEGLVQYQRLKSNRETLYRFVATLSKVREEESESWDEDEQVAFWITAYNAITLSAIINHSQSSPYCQSLPRSRATAFGKFLECGTGCSSR